MATKRREAVKRLAEVLEIEIEPGEGTAELLERCIAEVEGQRAERHEQTMADAEEGDRSDVRESRASESESESESEPEREPAVEQAQVFQLQAPEQRRRRRRASTKERGVQAGGAA